ncbi:MAG: undecaprenyl-phosphate glucose phosphotransferase [Candidatus Cryptobacteroides sp.]
MIYRLPAALIDLVLMIAVYKLMLLAFPGLVEADKVIASKRSVYFLVVGHLVACIFVPVKFYQRKLSLRAVFQNSFFHCLLSLGVFAASIDQLFHAFAGRFYLLWGIASTISLGLLHLGYMQIVSVARKYGRNKIHTVIIGTNDNALKLSSSFCHDQSYYSYKFLGFIADESSALPEDAVRLCSIDRARDYLSANKIHEVYCALDPRDDSSLIVSLIRCCENNFIDFYFVPAMEGYPRRTLSCFEQGGVNVFKLRDEPLENPVNIAIKRLFDILVSGIVLLTLYPFIWLFVAVGTSLSSPGPILFRQKRTGYKGRPFTMYKFRSMRVNDQANTLQATKDDVRKTRFGNFLRRTSIDEIPQLINVFKGDMSLVGPRPHMEAHTRQYSAQIDEYLVRHMVKPGLTGWAQVNGCRGETRTVKQMSDRVNLDIWYVEHWSFSLDLRIIVMTLVQIVKGDKQAY